MTTNHLFERMFFRKTSCDTQTSSSTPQTTEHGSELSLFIRAEFSVGSALISASQSSENTLQRRREATAPPRAVVEWGPCAPINQKPNWPPSWKITREDDAQWAALQPCYGANNTRFTALSCASVSIIRLNGATYISSMFDAMCKIRKYILKSFPVTWKYVMVPKCQHLLDIKATFWGHSWYHMTVLCCRPHKMFKLLLHI